MYSSISNTCPPVIGQVDLYYCSLSSASSLLLAEFQQKVAPDQGDQEVAPQQDQGHGGAGQAAVDREAGHY